MSDNRCIIEIDGTQYVVDQTFGGAPAIYYVDTSKYSMGDHIDHKSPRPDDCLMIICHLSTEPILSPQGRYKVANKLGPWFRGGMHGERWLATGLQHKPVYKRITDVRKGDTPYYLKVQVQDNEEYHGHGVGTNTYERH